ncbi:Carboxylic ester hydrolase [Fusarium sp. Ph1]|nr:Carboxylic ester hydrolase [Fusarium sp. Ph1]
MWSGVYRLQGLLLCISLLVSVVESITVHANGVRYVGLQNYTSRINTFWGIRYAEPPVKELRWREPVPFNTRWRGVRHIRATEPPPACWQSTPAWRPNIQSDLWQDEDCLRLNIQTPMDPAPHRLPVLIMIHGGGYLAGSTQFTTGDSLVHQSNGSVIYVSVQYRLGALGFLGGDELRGDGTQGTWNAGLLDQRLALDWVRDNIQYFGGDPTRITITGSSAGGGSVALQMVMYGGRPTNPPFQAAIPEFPWWTPMYGNDWVQDQYKRFLGAANCDSISCLRKLPIEAIQAATRTASESAYADKKYAFGTFYWGPTIDGRIIEANLQEEFRQGHFTKVPILVDRNFDEGFIFSNTSVATDEDAMSDLAALWHDDTGYYADTVWSLYPESSYNTCHLSKLPVYDLLKKAGAINNTLTNSFIRRSALFGDALVGCPTTYMAQAVAKAGIPAYKLIFNSGYQFHSATDKFVYSNYTNADGSRIAQGAQIPGNATVATLLRQYILSFTMFHEPNGLGPDSHYVPEWPKYTTQKPKALYLANTGVEVVDDFESSVQCHFFRMGRGNNAGLWPDW